MYDMDNIKNFIDACKKGNLKNVSEYHKKLSLERNCKGLIHSSLATRFMDNGFYKACKHGRVQVVCYLLQYMGGDFNVIMDGYGYADCGKSWDVIEFFDNMMWDHACHKSVRNKYNRSPMRKLSRFVDNVLCARIVPRRSPF